MHIFYLFVCFIMFVICASPLIILFALMMNSLKSGQHSARKSSYNEFDNKGNHGEQIVSNILKNICLPNARLCNLYVPTEDGFTTEIDVLMITTKGIFVFESKNYNGLIYGSENQKEWIAEYNEQRRYPLYNPIWQNRVHIKALKNVLGHPDCMYRSYIVFGDSAVLDNIKYNSEKSKILNQQNLYMTLSDEISSLPDILPEGDIVRLSHALHKYTNPPEFVKYRHVENIQHKKGYVAPSNRFLFQPADTKPTKPPQYSHIPDFSQKYECKRKFK